MRTIVASESQKPIRSPMDLDVGRVTPLEAIYAALACVGLFFTAALGGLVMYVVYPHDGLSPLEGWRLVLLIFGMAVSLFSFGLAVTLTQLIYQDWIEYRLRLNDWHEIAIAAATANDGQEIERTLTITDLSPAQPLHMLAIALSAHARVASGTAGAFSVRELEGPVMLGPVKFGDLSRTSAESASKRLADLGLIKDRAPKKAGTWAAQSEHDVINAVIDGWVRLRGL